MPLLCYVSRNVRNIETTKNRILLTVYEGKGELSSVWFMQRNQDSFGSGHESTGKSHREVSEK